MNPSFDSANIRLQNNLLCILGGSEFKVKESTLPYNSSMA